MSNVPTGITVAGNIEPIEGNLYASVSRINGWVWQRRYRGLSLEANGVFVNAINSPGVGEVVYQQEGAEAEVTITYTVPPYGMQEQAQETLDLDFEEKNGSIFFNDYFSSIAADPKRVATVRLVADGIRALNALTDDVAVQSAAMITKQALTAKEQEALNFLLFDQDTYEWSNPVLTFTRVVSPFFNTSIVISDQDKIWTSAQVATYLDARAILFAIPQVLNAVTGPGLPGWRPGWRKQGRFQWQADGKCQMVEKFTFGVYSPLYPSL